MKRATAISMLAMLAGATIAASGSASAASYRLVYAFQSGADGANPLASLIDVGGTLYGTTGYGGAANLGTVFAVDPTTGAETVVHAFKGGAEIEGANPNAAVTEVDGKFYGTANQGGAYGFGTVFRLDPTNGKLKVLHAFMGNIDGIEAGYPNSSLVNIGSTLYGTAGGGANSIGTVFAVNRATGAETVVYNFAGGHSADYYPQGVIDIGGSLYGSAYGGEVFAVNPATGTETVLYTFKTTKPKTGKWPDGGLIKVGGSLYGTTQAGGSLGHGVVFKVNLTTGAEKVVYSFAGGSDGAQPGGSLIDVGGTLYGTTFSGGTGGYGTVFAVNLAAHTETVVYAFQGGSDGASPEAGLIDVGGTLYGTTVNGGGSGTCSYGGGTYCGTVFAITP